MGAVTDPQFARSRAELARELLEDRSAEVRELSRFLHDTVAQDLVKLSFFIHELPEESVSAPTGIDKPAALAMVARCCHSIRTISSILAPVVLAGMPLHAALEQYLTCFREETGFTVRTDFDPLPPLTEDLERLLCTVVQMWLARSVRSGPGALVTVRLRDRDNMARLELETSETGSVGLRGSSLAGWSMVRERVASLGGEFAIASDAAGVRCRVGVPASGQR